MIWGRWFDDKVFDGRWSFGPVDLLCIMYRQHLKVVVLLVTDVGAVYHTMFQHGVAHLKVFQFGVDELRMFQLDLGDDLRVPAWRRE